MKVYVGDGKGLATRLVQELPYLILGYIPYPGTVNFRVPKKLDLGSPDIEHEGQYFWEAELNGNFGHIVRWKNDKRVTSFEFISNKRIRVNDDKYYELTI